MLFNRNASIFLASAFLFAPANANAISSFSGYKSTPEKRIQEQLYIARDYSGTASWYGPGFYGRTTANGETYRPGTYTVAHRYLPFGTRVRITNLRNMRSIIARVNDRGPYVAGRIVDLGEGTARYLGVTSSGLAQVTIEVLD